MSPQTPPKAQVIIEIVEDKGDVEENVIESGETDERGL